MEAGSRIKQETSTGRLTTWQHDHPKKVILLKQWNDSCDCLPTGKLKKVCEKDWEELFQRQFLPSFLSHHFRYSKNCNKIMSGYMEVGSRMKQETSTGKLEHHVDMRTWWTSKLSWFLANPNWRHWKQSYSKFPNTIRNTGFNTGTMQFWWFAAYIPLAHSEHSKFLNIRRFNM